MTDIDFDELDKAVSSALKPTQKDKEPTVPPSAPVPEVETPKVETKIILDPPKTTMKDTAEAQPTPESSDRRIITSPAARRSGRFMDVVHPSSDMGPEKKFVPTPKIKIVPTENAPKPQFTHDPAELEAAEAQDIEPVAETVEVKSAEEAPKKPEAKEEAKDDVEALVAPKYPDPLDVIEKPETETEGKAADEPAKDDTPEPDVEPVAEPTPKETPFIPDAKVEKRPLGGFAPDAADELSTDSSEPASEAKTEGEAASEEQLPPEVDLPPALQSDVVAVESDVVLEEPVVQAESKKDDAKEEHDTPASEKVSARAAIEAIPQQYHTAPAETDETPRPVFDTEHYHQPLIAAHSKNKSHTWLYVLLIIGLLIVGAGLGYFAFVSGF